MTDLEPDREKGYRRGPSAHEKVEFCIQQLERGDAGLRENIAHGLTVEEVAGALLHARDELEQEDGL